MPAARTWARTERSGGVGLETSQRINIVIINLKRGKKACDNDDMIGCDECLNYFHPECIDMDQGEFQEHVENKEDEWYCDDCLQNK